MPLHSGAGMRILFPIVAVAIVLMLRFRAMGKERPLKVETLWVVPVIYLLLSASILYTVVPSPLGWGLFFAGVSLGVVIGWHRGKLTYIHRAPVTGELRQRASPLAMLLLLALVLLKLGARALFGESGSQQAGGMLLTDAFVGFALGLLSATRVEIYIRARKILQNG